MLRALAIGLEILGIGIVIWLNIFGLHMTQGELLTTYLGWWILAVVCILAGIIFEAVE